MFYGSMLTEYTFVFINIRSVVKPVYIFSAKSRDSKSCLMAELCFYCFLHFACVLCSLPFLYLVSFK